MDSLLLSFFPSSKIGYYGNLGVCLFGSMLVHSSLDCGFCRLCMELFLFTSDINMSQIRSIKLVRGEEIRKLSQIPKTF
jgi:hypothetical protein